MQVRSYVLRDVSADLLDRAVAHAETEGLSVRGIRAHCSSLVRSLGLMFKRTGRGPRFAIRASWYSMYERHGNSVS
jgi:hypothetical protein